jgi:[ribosomal protein S5]-alanine N-acetyltransferase
MSLARAGGNRGAAVGCAHTHAISTRRLKLLPMTAAFLEACLRGDKDRAEALIGLCIPAEWLAQAQLIEARLVEFREDPAYAIWGLRAIALEESRAMIGHVGYHSLPDPEYLKPYWPGGIELAYAVYPQHRRKGYALEAVAGLMRWALDRALIRRFLASVAAENLPSRSLAEKLGFVKVEEYLHDESGQRCVLYVLQGAAFSRLASDSW